MVGLEVAAALTFALASAKIVFDLGLGIAGLGPWALGFVAVVPLSYAAADLATGFVHFLVDNFGSERTPVLGRAFVVRFRRHHADPTEICRLGFREINGNSMMVAVPIVVPLALALDLDPIAASGWGLAVGAFVWLATVFGVFTNQIHRWAHDEDRPAWVRPLQRLGLLLSPDHHQVHHRLPHDEHFCITNGWLNPLLDRFGVWHHAADVLVALGLPQVETSVFGKARRAG